MSVPVDEIKARESKSQDNLVRQQLPRADVQGYMRANRRLRWSFIVMGIMWFLSSLIFWLAAHRTFHTTKPSQTFSWLVVPEIVPAEVPVNVTTLLLLVASLNVALVVSEIGGSALKTAYQARWAEVTEYLNYGAAVFSLVMTTTVFFWNLHTFVVCAPMSILTAILAASAYQRSGGYIHRLAFEKRIAEAALRTINIRLGTEAPKDYTRQSLTQSSVLLVLAPAVSMLVVETSASVITPEAAWQLGAAPSIAVGVSSFALSVTRVFTVGAWESGRRAGSIFGWSIGGAIAFLVALTPISLATKGVGFVMIAVPVVLLFVQLPCLLVWCRASRGPWRTLHQISRRYAMVNVRNARKAFESSISAYHLD